MSKHLKKQELDDLLAEIADEAEATEHTTDRDAPLPAHVKVSQPGHARSKVLQVRLNPEELAALAAIAERRGLPVSTVAREQILRLVAAEQQPTQANPFLELLNEMSRLGGLADEVRQQLVRIRVEEANP